MKTVEVPIIVLVLTPIIFAVLYLKTTYKKNALEQQQQQPAEKVLGKEQANELKRTPCKMTFLVRTDLEMGKGKMCAQVGHAVSDSLYDHSDNPYIAMWKRYGEKKICVKGNEQDMKVVLQKAKELGIPHDVIHDAGHTQIEAGSATVAWFGPYPEEFLDQVTGSYKLL